LKRGGGNDDHSLSYLSSYPYKLELIVIKGEKEERKKKVLKRKGGEKTPSLFAEGPVPRPERKKKRERKSLRRRERKKKGRGSASYGTVLVDAGPPLLITSRCSPKPREGKKRRKEREVSRGEKRRKRGGGKRKRAASSACVIITLAPPP